MNIRNANKKDIPQILELLQQVLTVHADIRPDLFIHGTTKYTQEELAEMIDDENNPIYVATDENDVCVGYAFCQLEEQKEATNRMPYKTIYIDDLCVDVAKRGQHIGEALFAHVKEEAKRMGCTDITLHVWTGNTSAEKFYEKMGMQTRKRMMEIKL